MIPASLERARTKRRAPECKDAPKSSSKDAAHVGGLQAEEHDTGCSGCQEASGLPTEWKPAALRDSHVKGPTASRVSTAAPVHNQENKHHSERESVSLQGV